MITKHEARVTKDLANKKITVVKELDADIEKVWNAWTNDKQLEKWWAPKPWRAESKKMNFKEGGSWLYSMVGPNGERHWSGMDYKTIDEPNHFTTEDYFSDENGNKTADMPTTNWDVKFKETDNGTRVEVVLTASKQGQLEKLLEMGFEEGFKMGLDNLEELVSE
jgi:uncharacterized protein YndB with AHSA1/START domain